MSSPGAGWIPPEFREFVYEELSKQDIDNIRISTGMYEEIDGKFVKRKYTDKEILAKFSKVIGVIDTRDRSYHPNISKVPMIETQIYLK